MWFRGVTFALAVTTLAALDAPARADGPSAPPAGAPAGPSSGAAGPTPEAQAQAQQHFQRARELYQSGSYHDALTELEAAQALDPGAKDLLFNLGVVSEKLGKIDDALAYFKRYLEMDLTPQERARAEGFTKRLEGARHEIEARPAAPPTAAAPAPTEKAAPPANGRIDALTIATAAVTVVGLGVGTFFGVRALNDRTRGAVTSSGFTYDDYVKSNDRAHTEAIVADVGFAVGVAAAVATAYLYFARPKATATSPRTAASLWGAPARGGGVMGVEARF